MCDFSEGFRAPEMVKRRPVLVLSPAFKHRNQLVTVVPLSTTPPEPVCAYHYQLPPKSLPMVSFFQRSTTWVKADMIYTVGFHRLSLIQLGTRKPNGKRNYFTDRLGREQMRQIYACVLHGLNLGHVVPGL